jgi:hypothetical protein
MTIAQNVAPTLVGAPGDTVNKSAGKPAIQKTSENRDVPDGMNANFAAAMQRMRWLRARTRLNDSARRFRPAIPPTLTAVENHHGLEHGGAA